MPGQALAAEKDQQQDHLSCRNAKKKTQTLKVSCTSERKAVVKNKYTGREMH